MRFPRLRRALVPALLSTLASCGGGGGGGGGGNPPTSVTYTTGTLLLRQDAAMTDDVPVVGGGAPSGFSIQPSLPLGLSLDPLTGVVSGTPLATAFTATYTVTATNGDGQASGALVLQVAPPLPATFTSLEPGFQASTLLSGLPTTPVKLAFAPDGRLFFNELTTGNVRVLDANGVLVPTPVHTFTVLTGVEQGLLGLALSPTFASDGFLYVVASQNAGTDRNRILRITVDGNNVGSNPQLIVDDLPIAAGHNGGDLQFGLDGTLFVSTGDAQSMTAPQTDGALAGRVLRYTAAGAIPATNPSPSSPEWCRGLRNSFDLCVHPVTGGLFGSENGPTANDELNYLQSNRNYDWPSHQGTLATGYRMRLWAEVIAPTGLTFYTAPQFGAAYLNNLFLAGYVNADIRRFVVSGVAYTDIDSETIFATLLNQGNGNKPIDLAVAPDGSLCVSTIDGIYRISKYP